MNRELFIRLRPLVHRSLALSVALAAGLAAGATTSPTGFLLVANKGDRTLSIVDVAAARQVAVVPEDGQTGHEVAASPDGRLAFVPIYGNSGVGQPGTDGSLIRVIDLRKHKITGTIDFGKGVRPHCAVFGPRDGLLYVTSELENGVTVIDPKSLKILALIPTGEPQSHMLAISPDGRRGYTANVSTGTVSVLDLAARRLLTTIQVAPQVQRISVSVDGRHVFTADQTVRRVAVIDAATNRVSSFISLPGLGFGTTPTPDGRWLLVAMPALSEVGLVDLATMRLVRVTAVPKAPQEILVIPDGSAAFVSCDATRRIAVISLPNLHVANLIEVGAVDDGLAWARAD